MMSCNMTFKPKKVTPSHHEMPKAQGLSSDRESNHMIHPSIDYTFSKKFNKLFRARKPISISIEKITNLRE